MFERTDKPKLREALADARQGLQAALKTMIAARVPGNEITRLQTENTFEEVRNGRATLEALAAASEQLAKAAVFLANQSGVRGEDLTAVRSAASQVAKRLQELQPRPE